MSEVTENLILEQLREMRAAIGTLKGDKPGITARFAAIEKNISTLQSYHARTTVALDQLAARVERLEKTAGLVGQHTAPLDARDLAERVRLYKKATPPER